MEIYYLGLSPQCLSLGVWVVKLCHFKTQLRIVAICGFLSYGC